MQTASSEIEVKTKNTEGQAVMNTANTKVANVVKQPTTRPVVSVQDILSCVPMHKDRKVIAISTPETVGFLPIICRLARASCQGVVLI